MTRPSLFSPRPCIALDTIFTNTDMRPILLSRSLKHLDVGEVDLTSHIHVPAMNVQSYARNDCTGGFGHPMGHVSSLPSTWCGLPPGLVESQLLGGSQSQWSSAGSGRENCHAQSLMKIHGDGPSFSISAPPPNARIPSSVSPSQHFALRRPTPRLVSCLKSVTGTRS